MTTVIGLKLNGRVVIAADGQEDWGGSIVTLACRCGFR